MIGPKCIPTLVSPADIEGSSHTYYVDKTPLELDFSQASNGDCKFTLDYSVEGGDLSGSVPIAEVPWLTVSQAVTYVADEVTPYPAKFTVTSPELLLISSTDPAIEGDYTITVTLAHKHVPGTNPPNPASIDFTFDLTIIDNPCIGGLSVPSVGQLDTLIPLKMPGLQEFPLPGLSNGECEFWVDVTSIDNVLSSDEILSTFNATTTITQPVFVPIMDPMDSLYDARVIGLDADALLVVDSEQITSKTIV